MTHQQLYAAYMNVIASGRNSAFKELAARVPKELSYVVDGRELSARELLLSKDIEGADLVAVEFYNTVLEGANAMKCYRNVAPIFKMNSDVLNVPYGPTITSAITPIAEGAEVPVNVGVYAKKTFTAQKYGLRPLITDELIEDSKYDVIAMEVARVGQRLELGLDQQMHLEYVTDATATSGDCGGSGANMLSAISSAMAGIDGAGFKANAIVLCPVMFGALRASLAGTGSYQQNNFINGAPMAQLYGLPVYVSGHTPASAANWRFTTNDDIGALVLDTTASGGIGMRKDITVENFRDPIHGLQNVVATMRYDVQAFLGGAIAKVIY
jgi:HK97 family phage major capsid protein